MKILILVNNYLQKDVVSSKRWRCLSKEMARQGNDVTVVCGTDPTYNGELLSIHDFKETNLKVLELDSSSIFHYATKYKKVLGKKITNSSIFKSEEIIKNSSEYIEKKITLFKYIKERIKLYIEQSLSIKSLRNNYFYNDLINIKYDVLISSIYYQNSFFWGEYLKKRHKESLFICDIRDRLFNVGFRSPEYDKVHRDFAKKITKKCDYIFTVSDIIKDDLLNNEKNNTLLNDKIKVFPHGYDLDEDVYKISEELSLLSSSNALELTFTGTCKEDLDIVDYFFKVLVELKKKGISNSELHFNYAGRDSNFISDLARRNGIMEFVNDFGFIPKKKALQLQYESDVLLIFSDVVSGKIPEYMISGKYLLAIHNNNRQNNPIMNLFAITNTGNCYCIYEPNNELVNKITDLINIKKRDKQIVVKGIKEGIEKYNCSSIAKEMLLLINKIKEEE